MSSVAVDCNGVGFIFHIGYGASMHHHTQMETCAQGTRAPSELLDGGLMRRQCQAQTRRPLAGPSDMKIHQHLMRVRYGRTYLPYHFLRLANLPLLYGIWHPKKCSLTVLYRRCPPCHPPPPPPSTRRSPRGGGGKF